MIDAKDTIYLYNQAVDMRYSIDRLTQLAFEFMSDAGGSATQYHLFESRMFVFFNKSANKVKLLIKENNGFCLIYKCLDRGSFCITLNTKGCVTLTKQHLRWLLDGLDIKKIDKRKTPVISYAF